MVISMIKLVMIEKDIRQTVMIKLDIINLDLI